MKQFIQQHKKTVAYLVFIVLFIMFMVLLYLPANYFDEGQSICISVLLFDIECFGCGMTRAIQHLLHLDLSGALYYNKFSFVVFPLIIFLLLNEFYKIIFLNK